MEAAAGSLDLFSSTFDTYDTSTTIYQGMSYFDIAKTGANGFESDKFMISNSTSYNYDLNLDIRYELGDEVDIYTFFKDSAGTVTGQSAMRRTLNAINMASAGLVLFCSGALSLFW